MLGRLQNYEITPEVARADVIIVNTCGFIKSAKEESIRAILDMHEARKKGSLLVVTGCLMQRYREELMKELPEVDLFTGVGDYDKIDEIILKKQNLFSPDTYLQANEERVITGSNYHAYIKISEGCNQKCSFCAIPTFKGKLKSRALENIVGEVEKLVKKGYYDFSFLSQDSSSYMRDHAVSDGLISLIDAVEKIEGVKTARILYLYPSTTSNALIERIIASPVFANYFDMPIQHASDKMLKIMRRGSGAARIKELLNLMKSAPGAFLRTGVIVGHPGESEAEFDELLNLMKKAPNAFLRTGVIVGHPGESEAEFDELCAFLQEFKFDRVSAFAYSKEEDTLSYEMEQVPAKIISKRLSKIEKITRAAIEASFAQELGKKFIVSLEGESSEGEMFYAAKKALWDKDIDGEILINESDIEQLETGGRYWCEITQVAGSQALGKITAKA